MRQMPAYIMLRFISRRFDAFQLELYIYSFLFEVSRVIKPENNAPDLITDIHFIAQ